MCKKILCAVILIVMLPGCGALQNNSVYINSDNAEVSDYYTSSNDEPSISSSSLNSSACVVAEKQDASTPYLFTTCLNTGKWVYQQFSSGGNVYKVNPLNGEKEIICDKYVGDFWVVENTLYYTDYTDDFVMLYKKDLVQGTQTILAEELQDESATYILGDWIYYISFDNNLYRVNTETTTIEKINDCVQYWFYGNQIYAHSNDETSLYQMNLDGKNVRRIASTNRRINNATFIGEFMYFTDISYPDEEPRKGEKRYIFKLSLKSGEIVSWVEAYTNFLDEKEGYIYFTNDYPEIGKTGDYRVNIETGEVEKIG